MRVLFVTPPPWRRVLEPSLGIGYVAAVTRAQGHDVLGCEMNAEALTTEDFGRIAAKYEPDVVAVTALTANVKNACKVAQQSKQVLPSVPVILGGPHATFAYGSLLREESSIDVAMLGESELSFLQLLTVVHDRKHWSDVQGTAFRGEDGVRSTGMATPEQVLDRLPFPDREVLQYDHYIRKNGYATMITSRGCSFSCRFCDVPIMMGRGMRYRSIENVVAEIDDLTSRGCRSINFRDDVFTINRKRTIDLVQALKPHDIEWGCETRVDLVDEEKLGTMQNAGLTEIRFGAESLNKKGLGMVNKGITVEEILSTARIALRLGIRRVRLSFILGIPGETLEDMVRTIELAESLHPAECRFWSLTPNPGTQFANESASFGIRPVSTNWGEYNAVTPVTETDSLTLEELKQALRLAYQKHGHPLLGAIN